MLADKKILLIDDDPAIKYLTRIALQNKESNGNIAEVSNGLQAMELLLSGVLTPDIILLDLDIPVMNGHEFLLEYAKYGLQESNIKVYVLTSHVDDNIVRRVTANGVASGVFEKPLTHHHVRQIEQDFKIIHPVKN